MELLLARNPDADSTLPFLLRVPLGDGLVFRARGREVVFWQSPRTSEQSRRAVRIPSARGSGLSDLVIVVDAHKRYP